MQRRTFLSLFYTHNYTHYKFAVYFISLGEREGVKKSVPTFMSKNALRVFFLRKTFLRKLLYLQICKNN